MGYELIINLNLYISYSYTYVYINSLFQIMYLILLLNYVYKIIIYWEILVTLTKLYQSILNILLGWLSIEYSLLSFLIIWSWAWANLFSLSVFGYCIILHTHIEVPILTSKCHILIKSYKSNEISWHHIMFLLNLVFFSCLYLLFIIYNAWQAYPIRSIFLLGEIQSFLKEIFRFTHTYIIWVTSAFTVSFLITISYSMNKCKSYWYA